jgi:hypothetical protein
MRVWQPFIVVENDRSGPKASHQVVLRVKHAVDMYVFEADEATCFKEAHSLNERVRLSLSDFIGVD